MIPWFELRVVHLGPIPIQVWGFFVALGIVLGTWLLAKTLQEKYKIKPEHIMDLAVYLVLFGFLGARIFHIVFYEPVFYLMDPVEILKIWHGGLSSFGGFVGGGVGLWIYKKRRGFGWLKKLPMMTFMDHLVQMLLLGWMVGRIGCVMIHDHPGVLCDCTLALDAPSGARLDMALLEILGLLPLALFFFLVRKKKYKAGTKTAVLLIYYGILRFILDFWRAQDLVTSDARYGGLTPAQYLSMLMAALGVHLLAKGKK